MADSSLTVALVFADIGCASCSVVRLYSLQRWMVGEKIPTLHESDGMGVDLGDIRPVIVGQTADAVLDVQFMFTDDRCA